MASMAQDLKLHLFVLSVLSFSLSLLVFTRTFNHSINNSPIVVHLDRSFDGWSSSSDHLSSSVHRVQRKKSPLFDFLSKELFDQGKIKIGLVNVVPSQGDNQEWRSLGETSLVEFERVQKERSWEEYFPEWIDEDEKWSPPKCPELPMPVYKDYDEFDIVVANVPCGDDGGMKGKGIRDVFRLQVNLVVANLVIKNGMRRKNGGDPSIYLVFIAPCGPMWEIFRCDDLLRHEGDVWIYKPDLRRLEQKIAMPVGTCKLALAHNKQEGQGITYDLSKLPNPIKRPREAYVTVLHSSEAYVCGAIVLAQSIIQSKSTKDLIILIDKSISQTSRRALAAAGWKIKHIERIRSPQAKSDAYNSWNYSKLRIWQLTEYDKVIFIDSDLLVLENMDKFFQYPQLSAVGNDNVLFNSGVMLIEPSNCTFKMLMKKRQTLLSYNGGDQGFLNEAFTWWHRWPRQLNFLKNFDGVNDTQHMIPEGPYAIHYLGLKPWMCYRDYDCNWDMLDHHPFASDSAHRIWWRVHDKMPKKLHRFCTLNEHRDARIKKWRKRAEKARLPDGHWRINVKDPREIRCKDHCNNV